MKQVFKINFRLPSLNEYIRQCRSNRYAANKAKQDIEQQIMWLIKQQDIRPCTHPVQISLVWHEPNRRRDKDNVAFAKKYILDALQKSGILPNDNNDWVTGFKDKFVYGADVGVTVVLLEVQKMEFNGIALRNARIDAGLTQRELAKLVGVEDATISQYERGRCWPSNKVAKRLENALNVTLPELCYRKTPENPSCCWCCECKYYASNGDTGICINNASERCGELRPPYSSCAHCKRKKGC